MQFSRLPLGIALIAVVNLAVVTTIPVKNNGELDRVKKAAWSWPWSKDIEQHLKPTQPENSTSAVVNTTTVDAMTILDALNNAASVPSSSSPSVSTTKLAETSEQIIAISGNKAENSKDNFAENISQTEFLTVAEKPTEMMEDDVNAAHKEPEKAEEVVTGNELSSAFKMKAAPTESVTELPTDGTMDSVTEDLGSINTTEVSGLREEGSKDEDFDKSKGDTIPSSTLEERSDTLSMPRMPFMKEMPFVKPSQKENTTASKTHLTTTEHEDFPTTPPIVKPGNDASKLSDKFDEESKSDDENLNPFQSDIDMMKVTRENVSMDSGDSESGPEKEIEIVKAESDAARTQISMSRIKDFQTVPNTPKADVKRSTATPTEESKIEGEIAKLDSFSDEIAASKRKIEGEAMINGIFAKIDKQLNEIPTEEPNATTKIFHDANKIVISSTRTKVGIPVNSLMEEFERVSTTGATAEFFHKEDVDPTEIYEWKTMSENASVGSNHGIMNMEAEMIPTTLTPVIPVLVDVASDQNAGKGDAFEPEEVEASIQKDVGVGLEAVYNHDKMNIEEPMLTTLPPDSTTVFEETKAQQSVNDLEKLYKVTKDEQLLPAASELEPEVAVTTLPPESAAPAATADASTDIDEKAEETEAEVPLDKDPDLHAELAARELEPASQDKIIEPIMLTTVPPENEISTAEAVPEQKNNVHEIEETNANAIKNLPTSVVRTTLRSGVYAVDPDMAPVVEDIVAADETEVVDKAIEQDPASETSVEVQQTTKSPEVVEKPGAGMKEHVVASAVEFERTESTAAVEKYQAANDFPKTTKTTTTLAIKEASAIPEDEIEDNQDASSVSLDDSVEKHTMTEPRIVKTTDKTGQMSKPVEDKNPDPVAKEGNEEVDDELATTKPRTPSLTPEESAEEDIEDGTGNGPVEESMKDVTEVDELESKVVPKEDAADEKNDEISEDEKPVPKRTMMDDAKVAEVVETVDLQKKTTKQRTEFMFPKEEVPDDSASRTEHDERIPMMVGLGVGSGICVLIVVFTVACIRRKRAQGEHELVPQTEPL